MAWTKNPLLGFVTNSFDTLAIGSFAPTAAHLEFRRALDLDPAGSGRSGRGLTRRGRRRGNEPHRGVPDHDGFLRLPHAFGRPAQDQGFLGRV